MARTQETPVEFNTFVKGIVTEAGPLTFPDNASLDESNFVLNRDGSRQRRFGMDYEADHSFISGTLEEGTVYQSFKWTGAANRGDLDIIVVQAGINVYFFDGNSDSISSSRLALTDFPTFGSGEELQFSSLYGNLLIADSTESFWVLEYNPDTDSVSWQDYRIKTRDLFGIEELDGAGDPISVDLRPSILTHEHDYNLRNQGWPEQFACSQTRDGQGLPPFTDPVQYTKDRGGIFDSGPGYVYPNNTDILWANKMASAFSISNIDAYSLWLLTTNLFTGTQSPRGGVIIDVFNRGESRIAYKPSLTTLPADESVGAITAIAAYAGRAFFAIREDSKVGTDNNSPNLSSMIFYSQVGSSIDKLTKCHGELNPTAEDLNSPIDTDGGFVTIPEVGEIMKLVPLGDSLFVIASNGVWEIHGGEGSFSATNQSLAKTSSVGAISRTSIVVSEDVLSYWADGGIYVITIDSVSLRGKSTNSTQASIQSLYNAIGGQERAQARGTYDESSQQLRWLYREGTLPFSTLYNRELVFDNQLQAFYVNKIGVIDEGAGHGVPYVAGYVDVSQLLFSSVQENVTVDGVQVTSGGLDVYVTERAATESAPGSTKYLAVMDLGAGLGVFTFSQFRNLDYLDWETEDGVGVDAAAFLLTGYLTGGDTQKYKQSSYITNHFRLTEEGFDDDGLGNLTAIGSSSCMVQGQWEWTNSENAGRWSREFQAYRLPRPYTPENALDFDYGFTVVTTKNKLRGKGRALSILYSTEAGKNCHIYGWALNIDANAKP